MTDPETRTPFGTLQRDSLLVGLAGAGLCAWGALTERQQFLRSYLVAYAFWIQIPLGALALAMLHQLVWGRWGLLTGRLFESAAGTLLVSAALFAPIAWGVEELYIWARPDSLGQVHHHQQKALYLNRQGYLARSTGYFATWVILALVLNRWSLKQDATPDPRRRRNLSRLSAGGLVVLMLTVTFAGIDWLMSLEPNWYSTLYGGIYAVGSVLAALAFVIACAASLSAASHRSGVLWSSDRATTQAVWNDLGNLLLAFVMLWSYLVFSQFLIIWSGDLPDEIVWYANRLEGGWQPIAVAILLLHFVLPFLLLLGRDVKRDPRRLRRVALLLLGMRYVDMHWTITPAFFPGTFHAHWLDAAALAGVGGVWVFACVTIARNKPLRFHSDQGVTRGTR